ncbi:unnamed protein product [Nezara viridula]|uniref:Uncharacterized protein n=1 Tax=Nezara viridula TaxID=85310 RepID=A0A9P0HAA2_NEZVI|nr:unnamed protein product [Nezara viridula]
MGKGNSEIGDGEKEAVVGGCGWERWAVGGQPSPSAPTASADTLRLPSSLDSKEASRGALACLNKSPGPGADKETTQKNLEWTSSRTLHCNSWPIMRPGGDIKEAGPIELWNGSSQRWTPNA